MNICGYAKESIVDGQGLRAVVFFSGCSHNCLGCHSPQTHNREYGEEFTDEKQQQVIDDIKRNPILSGITLSGGDCFFSAKEVVKFVTKLKDQVPNINIWAYTGFTFEHLIAKHDSKYDLLMMCDVIVDGKFVLGERDITILFAGSKNQRIIDVKKSLRLGEVTVCP